MDKKTGQRRDKDLSAEAFNRLLEWLDQDRNNAGQRYEEVRSRLIKIFECRGCLIPEDLADETINRVTGKVAQIAEGYVGDPAFYFYAVAEKIYLEYSRKSPSSLLPLPPDVADKKGLPEEADRGYRCLEQCMEQLSGPNRRLILAYYAQHENSRSKIKDRKELSAQMGIGTNALWIRVHRIRESLKKCVAECLQRNLGGYSGDIQ